MTSPRDWQSLARQKLVFDAVKAYRQETGAGLGEAKDFIERWITENALSPFDRVYRAVCATIQRVLRERALSVKERGLLVCNGRFPREEAKTGAFARPDIEFFRNAPGNSATEGDGWSLPDLGVVILAPDDRYTPTQRRIMGYVTCGIRLLWVVDSEDRSITEYRPDRPLRILGEADIVSAEDVLPGFQCKVADLIP